MTKEKRRVHRDPIVMIFAVVIWLVGVSTALLGIAYFSSFGWWAIPLIAGGLSSVGFATATMVTGKPEWILIDLILPG